MDSSAAALERGSQEADRIWLPDIHFYGGNSIPFEILAGTRPCPDEMLIEGPANTGKSLAIGQFLWSFMDDYPDAVILIMRKTRVSLNISFLDTWENEVIGADHPSVLGRVREKREWYRHPNGALARLGGYNDERSLFSTQHHIIFVNEAAELTKKEVEQLHRGLRRKGAAGWQLLIMDTNPDFGGHHLNRRFPQGHLACEDGRLRVLSRHRDNPGIPAGYLRRMERNTSGSTRDRLYLGLWRSAEGRVYKQVDTDHHLITARLAWPTDAYGDIIRGESVSLFINRGWLNNEQTGELDPVEEHRTLTWFGGSLDFGWDAPGSFGVWGVDGDRRAYRVRETYYTEKTLDWWADVIFDAYQEFRFRFVVADSSEPRSIKHINDRCQARGMPRIVVPVDKPARKFMGFNHVRDRLEMRPGATGQMESFIYILRDILWAPPGINVKDPRLEECSSPIGLAAEIVSLVLAKPRETEKGTVPMEESDDGCADHACFPAGTLVTTPHGQTPIECLSMGDEVLVPDGIGHVNAHGLTAIDAPLVRIVHEHGDLLCTPDHPIWIAGIGFRRADALMYGDRLECVMPVSAALVGGGTPIPRRPTMAPSTTGRPWTGDACAFTERFGAATAERCLRATTSTTRTGIALTTALRTSNWSPSQSMGHSIDATRTGSWRSAGAGGAGRERTGVATGCENAGGALQSSCPIGATTYRAPRRVPRRGFTSAILAIEPLGERRDVFNLTVSPQHAYYAEGVLVSNCDDMMYFALHAWKKDLSKKPSKPTIPPGVHPYRMEDATLLEKEARREARHGKRRRRRRRGM